MSKASISGMEYEAELPKRLGQGTFERPGDYWVPMTRARLAKRMKELGLSPGQAASFTRPYLIRP